MQFERTMGDMPSVSSLILSPARPYLSPFVAAISIALAKRSISETVV
jgi:hypothetical protein